MNAAAKESPKSNRRLVLYSLIALVIIAAAIIATYFFYLRNLNCSTVSDKGAEYLMVQEAEKGNLKLISQDIWQLSLEKVNSGTIYFSNTPETIAGTVATQIFVENFKWDIKPNIAVSLQDGDLNADVVIMQVQEQPVYDVNNQTIIYKAKMIDNYNGSRLNNFNSKKDPSIPESFGFVSIYIDNLEASCWDTHVQCYSADICCSDPTAPEYDCGGVNVNQCWSWSHFWCEPCKSATVICPQSYPKCCVDGYCVYGCHTTGCPFHQEDK